MTLKIIETPDKLKVFVDKIIALYVEKYHKCDGKYYIVEAKVFDTSIDLVRFETKEEAENCLEEITQAIYKDNVFCYVIEDERAIPFENEEEEI